MHTYKVNEVMRLTAATEDERVAEANRIIRGRYVGKEYQLKEVERVYEEDDWGGVAADGDLVYEYEGEVVFGEEEQAETSVRDAGGGNFMVTFYLSIESAFSAIFTENYTDNESNAEDEGWNLKYTLRDCADTLAEKAGFWDKTEEVAWTA